MDLLENFSLGRFDPSCFALRANIDAALSPDFDPDLVTLTLASFHYPFDDRHAVCINKASSPSKRALALNMLTLNIHETKHFHDMLISPYGSMLMRQYTRAALLFLTCKPDIIFRTSSLVLPFPAWVKDLKQYHLTGANVSTPSRNVVDFVDAMLVMQKKLGKR